MHPQLLVAYLFDFEPNQQQDDGFIPKLKNCVKLIKLKHRLTILSDLDAHLESMHKKHTSKSIKKLSQLVEKLLLTIKPDENLLFFLVSHPRECSQTFGKNFLSELLSKTHPQGLKQTERYLVQQYDKRGFGHLKTTIRKKIAALS